jgi:hypothetical protein
MPILKENEINTAFHGRIIDSGASVNEAGRPYYIVALKGNVS